MKEIQIRTAREIDNPQITTYIELADKLLPADIERLYIDLTNRVINYASILSSLKEVKHTLDNNSLSLLAASREINTLSDAEVRKRDVLKKRCTALKTNRSILKIHESRYNQEIELIIGKMTELIEKITNKGKEELETDVYEGLVPSFVNVRKACYGIVFDTSTVIIRKEQLKPDCRDILYIAAKSLELFDLEEVVNSNPSVIKLMNAVFKYLQKQPLDYDEIKSINESLKDTKYAVLSNHLESVLQKENKPFTY